VKRGISFSEKADSVIDDYMNEHNISSRSQAVNEIVESFQSEPSQPETTKPPELSPCATCYYEYTPDDFYTNPKYDDMLFPPEPTMTSTKKEMM